MKIVLWPSFYLPNVGGLEIMAHALAKRLQEEGHEIVVVTDHMNSERFQEFTIDGVKTHTFPFTTALLKRDLVLMKTAMARVRRVFEAFAPDVTNVHGWYEGASFYQTRVLEKTAVPFCITVHGLLEQEHYRTPSCLKLWSMARAANTVSRTLIDALQAGGFARPGLRVIYNGSPRSATPLVPLKADPPKLLMVGRLSVEKCFDVGFHALKALTAKHPGIKLVLIGGGDKFSELSELKSRLGLDGRIEMTGYLPPHRVSAYVDEASLVLVPSHYESFGLVALEAALRERPVVASGVHGLREVVAHQTTGLLVPPHDPGALARAVDLLLGDPDRMRAMGRAARLRATELFGMENAGRRYLEMYEEVRGGVLCRP